MPMMQNLGGVYIGAPGGLGLGLGLGGNLTGLHSHQVLCYFKYICLGLKCKAILNPSRKVSC